MSKSLIAGAAAVLSLAIASGHAHAADLGEGWTSVRALGMGNAYTAVVDDSDAMFYNPANMCQIKGINWTVFDPRAGLNGMETMESVQKLQAINDDVPGTLNQLYGKTIWAGGGVKSALTMPCFGLGLFVNTEAGYYQQSPSNTTINLNWYFDYGIVTAGAIQLIPGVFSLGLGIKRINRTGRTSPLGVATLAGLNAETLQAELKRRGTGYAIDVASTIRIPGPVSPAFSVVYHNLGNSQFTHEEGAGAPPTVEAELVMGGSITIDAAFITITPALDMRHVLNKKAQTGKKINAGVEIGLPLLDLRAGLHQGYYSAGVGLDLAILKFDVATYGVELGEYPGQHEDRRYMAQLTFELGFDPSLFGIGSWGGGGKGPNGERRRLKQRR